MSRWSVLLLPLLLSTAGCRSIMPEPGGAARRSGELAELEERVLELEREARMSEVEVARLRRQVAELRERLEAASRAPAVEPPPAPSAPSAPPAVVAPAPRERLEAESLEMPDPAPAREPAAPTPLGSEGQALYDHGYTLFHQGSYVDAENAFQRFLQQYGTSDLADNAQFWIGEARLRRGDLDGALSAFRETVSRFPRGNKIPDALFRSGDCLQKLGDLDGARAAWRQTIERYPNSAAAALSEERLAAER